MVGGPRCIHHGDGLALPHLEVIKVESLSPLLDHTLYGDLPGIFLAEIPAEELVYPTGLIVVVAASGGDIDLKAGCARGFGIAPYRKGVQRLLNQQGGLCGVFKPLALGGVQVEDQGGGSPAARY